MFTSAYRKHLLDYHLYIGAFTVEQHVWSGEKAVNVSNGPNVVLKGFIVEQLILRLDDEHSVGFTVGKFRRANHFFQFFVCGRRG